MANSFNAFLSDNESETGPIAKTKKTSKPKSTITRASKPLTRASAPQPVSHKTTGKKPFKKEKILEPSEVNKRSPKSSRGRGRGPRPGDTDSRNKRYFDKKSGTGRAGGAKKGGAGGHNWGSEIDKEVAAAVVAEDKEKVETSKDENPKVEAEDEIPPEPEKETFTLSEFLKKKKEKRSGVGFEEISAANVDEVNEGKMYTKKDKTTLEEEDVLMRFGGRKEKSKKESQNRAGTRKHVENLGFKIKNPERERGDRRSFRGRGRGGYRGRGERRGRSNRVDVDTNDQQNFPQLGA